jgi:hypothetical protein
MFINVNMEPMKAKPNYWAKPNYAEEDDKSLIDVPTVVLMN